MSSQVTQVGTPVPRRSARRRLAWALAVAVACVALLAGCMNQTEQWGFDLMNADRGFSALPALSSNDQLVSKAQGWAQHLADASGGQCTSATLAHSSLTADAPAGWQKLGENVACRVVQGTTADAVTGIQSQFMNSPGHRANILDSAYTHGGLGMAAVPSVVGPGWIAVYETQEFARL